MVYSTSMKPSTTSIESSSVGLLVPTATAGKYAADDETISTSASWFNKRVKVRTMKKIRNTCDNNIAAADAHEEGKEDDTAATCVGDYTRTEEEMRDGAEAPFVEEAVASAKTVNWSVDKSGGDRGIIRVKKSMKSNMADIIGKSKKSNASKKSTKSERSTTIMTSMKSKGSTNYNKKDAVSAAPVGRSVKERWGGSWNTPFKGPSRFLASSIVRRESSLSWVDIVAPPGKLGIIIDTCSEGPIVHGVKVGSPLEGLIFKGDLIVAIDDKDTREWNALYLTKLVAKKIKMTRKITVLRSADL